MKIAIPKERRAHERRVAASPDTAKRLAGMGFTVVVESGAGDGASFPDAAFEAAGATIAPNAAAALADADVVLKVQRPILDGGDTTNELQHLKRGAILIGILQALQNREDAEPYAKAGISSFDMTLIPRITRAQSMDVLSSQSNLA